MVESFAVLPSAPWAVENRRLPDPAALMALYDANYQCLLALCPALRDPALQIRRYLDDSLPGMPTLRLALHDHTRHTATLGLTCRWDSGEGEEYLPDVQLRLYRDSRQVELLNHHAFSPISGTMPDGGLSAEWLCRRHLGNWFLFNWLRHCLRQGYHLATNSDRMP